MALVLMGCEVRDIPIKPKEIQFDKDGKKTLYVDAEGKKVNKVQVQASEYKWLYEDGSAYEGKAYKAIKGKPVKEFSKTTLIDKYDTIDREDRKYFIENEHTYLMVNDTFKAKMKELGKAITFKFVIRGFKVYKAFVEYEPEFDRVLMRCFRGDIRDADLTESQTKEIQTKSDDNVAEMDLDALEV